MLENVGFNCAEEGCVGVKLYWTADLGTGRVKLQAQITGARWMAVGIHPAFLKRMEGAQAFMASRPEGSVDASELDMHQYEPVGSGFAELWFRLNALHF